MLPVDHNFKCAQLGVHCLLRLQVILLYLFGFTQTADVKWMIEDPAPLFILPSAFSASSVHPTLPDSQAHNANFDVFSKPEEFAGAWCPANPIQNGFTEWLQVDLDQLKIMRLIFTNGRGRNQLPYVPSFVIRYQRCDSRKWFAYRMFNGSQLLHTNKDTVIAAITLDPLIIAKRIRIYPYYELEPRSMCLRLRVYGSEYNDGVINYTIPEGDLYRLDVSRTVKLNDSIYDGYWTRESPFAEVFGDAALVGQDQRSYLHGGLGLLMDKQYYDGPLLGPRERNYVVGWFRRQYSVPTSYVTLSFNFDRVRNFTEVRLHTLNSLDYVSVFRRVLVQFSLGGQYFDRLSPPVLTEIRRDTSSQQARWVPISLNHRIGRSLRITLWFDYDWIVLSEVTFSSVPLPDIGHAWATEKLTDSVHRLPALDLSGTELTKTLNHPEMKLNPDMPTSISPVVKTVAAEPPVTGGNAQLHHSGISAASRNQGNSNIESAATVHPSVPYAANITRLSSTPYLIVIVCCCLGAFLFAICISFILCRFRRNRRDRLKKHLHLGKTLSQVDNVKQSQQPLHQFKTTSLPPGSYFTTVTANNAGPISTPLTGAVARDFILASKGAEAPFVINGVSASSSGATSGQLQPFLDSNSHLAQKYPLLDHMEVVSPSQYQHLVGGMNPDNILALQLLQQPPNLNSNFSLGGLTLGYGNNELGSLDSNTTLARRYLPVGSPYQLTCIGPTANSTPGKLPAFRPPPPPDQPLPPLPVSGPSNVTPVQTHAKEANVLSTSPYTVANFRMPLYPADTNGSLLVPLDSAMPEYASASIFSGSGALQHSPSRSKSIASTNTYKPVASSEAMDPAKFLGIGETYCVPHQNSVHRQFCASNIWPVHSEHSNINQPLLVTSSFSDADRFTESLDSSGMYYFSNSQDQLTSAGIPPYVYQNGFQQRPLLFPFTSPTHLIPVHRFGPIYGNQQISGSIPLSNDNINLMLHQTPFNVENAGSNNDRDPSHQTNLAKTVPSDITDCPPGHAPPPPGPSRSLFQNGDLPSSSNDVNGGDSSASSGPTHQGAFNVGKSVPSHNDHPIVA